MTPDANTPPTSGDTTPHQADITNQMIADLLAQNAQVLSYCAALGNQVNWLCQVVNQLLNSMPPFMRGAANVPANPAQFAQPGAGFPTPYPGHH